ncbi:nuclear transport factor 2 family protein [Actinocrinis puniceicyclus]|uniref:Nuclear transport factor 2 family protein n=1 Tax=Actinocrinis puniceicyclus TaxID=977794 RepID=A0A8J8BBE0_9ACTN|nr:nuclear transport factor 2 family protein [Actinocrinis puniceicyclus]MBS2962365.1 nuclear transport factor 2 family protein [Actinocrinis puniceicyclus]
MTPGEPRGPAQAVAAHCELFNRCVESGDWKPFLDTFTEDAVMTVQRPPLPAFVGREAIAAAYAEAPPRWTMQVTDVREQGADTAVVGFRWSSGRPGAMTVTWRGSAVCAVRISL